ncbi:hinge domain of cleavage stimulation factor subunit 2-domain-containing protein, partial [Lentinula raphanica]
VGNVPYNMGEACEQLIDVFKSVGQVVRFRFMYDRETGKPKGYGFCEFTGHEAAASAVRKLSNYKVGGRPLRTHLADLDRGELTDGGGERDHWHSDNAKKIPNFLASLPHGILVPAGSTVLDTISQTLATVDPPRLMNVLAHMKAFVMTHPEQARSLLIAHPQFAYALFQALLLNKIVDQGILQRMLAATIGSAAPPLPAPT